jgi:hypothetical protein
MLIAGAFPVPYHSRRIYRSDSLKQGTRARYTVNGSEQYIAADLHVRLEGPAVQLIIPEMLAQRRR